ncbi:Phosphoglucomutase, chloroplastic-like protein [Drosera capensis]
MASSLFPLKPDAAATALRSRTPAAASPALSPPRTISASSPLGIAFSAPRRQSSRFFIKSVPTKAIEGQKTGTSGLRKKALFNSLPPRIRKADCWFWAAMVVTLTERLHRYCDRRFIVIKNAGGNGVGKILVGKIGWILAGTS